MKIVGDLHTHTIYSHGKNTIEENVLKAKDLGLKKIVIADHGSGHLTYGVKKDKWQMMKNEIIQLRNKYPDINILMGIETNIMGLDGTIDLDEKNFHLYDVIYTGFHYGILPKKIKDLFQFYILNVLAKGLPFLRRIAKEINTKALLNAMERYPLYMITHPGAKLPIDIDKVAKKASEQGVVLEINSSHGHLSTEDIVIASKYNVKFAINSDAHDIENIGNFKEALERVRKSGIQVNLIVNAEEV